MNDNERVKNEMRKKKLISLLSLVWNGTISDNAYVLHIFIILR